jgi:hypothetical protein
VIAFAAGSALASAAIFGLLVLGWAKAWAVWLVSAAALAVSIRGSRVAWSRPHPLWLPALPGLVLTLVNALAPETQPDAAGYHLGLAAEWARSGAFPRRTGFYELLPLGLETLYLPAYYLAGAAGAKLVHFAFFAASLPLIARVGRQCGLEPGRAVLAAVFYSCTPVVMIAASSAYTDAAIVFFTLAAFSALLDRRDASAGLAAGFCFAIKVTGGIVPAAALIWLAARREWGRLARLAPAAAVVSLPWTLRAFILTGNPIAPLGNGVFPNDFFHAHSERVLTSYFTDYGGVRGWEVWRSLLWGGASLQGLIGPCCIVLVAAALALRRRETRPLVIAGAVIAAPWFANLGARFLMPALPFAALAAAAVLPRNLMAAATVLHAVLAWPAVMDLYADKGAWRLRGFPWQAALGIEPAGSYLARELYEYRFVTKAAARVKRGETMLDLYGLPYAYLPVVPLGPLPSAEFDNVVYALNAARGAPPDLLHTLDCRWPMEFLRQARISTEAPWPAPFSIAEAQPLRGGSPVQAVRNWFLDAEPNGGDSTLAMDNNKASRWSTLDPARGGEWWSVRFDRPVPLDGMRFHIVNASASLKLNVTLESASGRVWRACRDARFQPGPLVFYRKAAMAFAKSRGVRWIAGSTRGEGHGPLVRELEMAPAAYGVEIAERDGELILFRVKD